MANWRHKITGFRPLLREDATDETAEDDAKKMADHLRKFDFLKEPIETGEVDLYGLEESTCLEDVNDWLYGFWNYCDDNLIWVEMDKVA